MRQRKFAQVNASNPFEHVDMGSPTIDARVIIEYPNTCNTCNVLAVGGEFWALKFRFAAANMYTLLRAHVKACGYSHVPHVV